MNTDLISKQDKQAVVNLIDNMNAVSFYEANEHSKECYYDIRNAILAMPEQEPKTGHWIYIRNSEVNGLKIVECSECGKRTYGSGKYCPNCGRRMVEPHESEDRCIKCANNGMIDDECAYCTNHNLFKAESEEQA